MDDQAFSILLDSHPELATPTAVDNPGRPHMYTKDELHHITTYAKSHGIKIMPGINIPGHAGTCSTIATAVSTATTSTTVTSSRYTYGMEQMQQQQIQHIQQQQPQMQHQQLQIHQQQLLLPAVMSKEQI
jgi:N-acetyl-beta-hexosaminidase